MIHGGLRYLENGEIALVRESLRERDALLRNAPHFVRPLPTTVPIQHVFSGLLNSAFGVLRLQEPAGRARGARGQDRARPSTTSCRAAAATMPRHVFRGAGGDRGAVARPAAVGALLGDLSRRLDQPSGTARHRAHPRRARGGPGRARHQPSRRDATRGRRDRPRRHAHRRGIRGDGRPDRQRHRRLARRDQCRARRRRRAAGAVRRRHQGLAPRPRSSRPAPRPQRPHDLLRERRRPRLHPLPLSRPGARSARPTSASTSRATCAARTTRSTTSSSRCPTSSPASRCGRRTSSIATAASGRCRGARRASPGASRAIISSPRSTARPPTLCLVGGKWTTFRAFGEQAADRALAILGMPRKTGTEDLPDRRRRRLPGRRGRARGADRPARRGVRRVRGARRARGLALRHQRARDPRLLPRPAPTPPSPAPATPRPSSATSSGTSIARTLADLLQRRTSIAITGCLSSAAIARATAILAEELGWTAEQAAGEERAFRARLARDHGLSEAILAERDRNPTRSLACA